MKAALVGGAAALACLALALVRPAAFFPAYLAAAAALATLPIGCLAILCATHLVRGPWVAALRPGLERGVAGLPAAGLLFLPALAGIGWIYPWAGGRIEADHPAFRTVWLSPAFFCLRTVLYFVILSGFGYALLRARSETARTRLAAGGLIVYTLVATCAGVDWTLSVEPRFHSSIFGFMTISQQLLGGLAVAIVAGARRDGAPPREGGTGALLLSAILLWAYMHAMQFIIVWIANIPLEAAWYLRRGEGVWRAAAILLGLSQLVLPFLALLLPSVRSSRAALVALAILTILMRPVETAWLTIPAGRPDGAWSALALLASCLAAGGLWLAALGRKGRRFALRPAGA